MNMDQETEKKTDEAAQPGNGKTEPAFVSVEDRLSSENLHLRIMKLALETQLLEQQLHAKMQERDQLNRLIVELQRTLEAKYSIDLSTQMIRESDGAIVPRDVRQLMRPR